MAWNVKMSEQPSVTVLRVENGWLITTQDTPANMFVVPMKVAETPATLLEIVGDWARAQFKSTPPQA